VRFIKIDTISFTDRQGVQHAIKDIRPIPIYNTRLEINVEKGMFIDEVISDERFEGKGAEDLAYTIVDHNIIKMIESDFDLSRQVILRIPRVEENV